MTTKREQRIKDYKSLEARGYKLPPKRHWNSINKNAGSETDKHLHAKAATARVLWHNGYDVCTEVEYDGFEIDVLAFGAVGRQPIIIELETVCTDEIKALNRNKYESDGIREVYTIPLRAMGWDCRIMAVRIAEKLGLEYEYTE